MPFPQPSIPRKAMPANSTPSPPSPNALVADRATALRNAGIRRHRNTCSDIVERSTSPADVPEHHRSDTVMQEAAQPRQAEPEAEAEAEALPAGCAMGIPIVMGSVAQRVPMNNVTIDLAVMRSIQADNYKFIRHMIMSGWRPTRPTACSFSITINRNGQQERWNVKEATPLHYAVCCGSLQAAAAILIAFPELAEMSCKVETSSSSLPQQSVWTTLDLTSFFGALYMSLDEARHQSYQQASLVLLHLKQQPGRLPFMQHSSAVERLEAAGKNAEEVTTAMLAAMQ